MLSFLILAALIYGTFAGVLLYHFKQITATLMKPTVGLSVTVLVPVRNEQHTIERLVHSIFDNRLNGLTLEVLLVDDHSDDHTVATASALCQIYPQLALLSMPEGKQGKKAAIAYGVWRAKGELIVCTDGDSEVPAHWICQHASSYLEGNTMSFGRVEYFSPSKNSLIHLLNIELSGLVVTGAATLQMKRPTMINGCNYSFAKTVFEEIGGFSGNASIPSGDDEFLLRKIYRRYPGTVRFLTGAEALVHTAPPRTITELIHQRRRWAAKWRFHQDFHSKLAPTLLFLAHSLLLIVYTYSLFHKPWLGFGVFTSKSVIDYTFLKNAGVSRINLWHFSLLQVVYPFYVVFFGIASLRGTYRWRGRRHKI